MGKLGETYHNLPEQKNTVHVELEYTSINQKHRRTSSHYTGHCTARKQLNRFDSMPYLNALHYLPQHQECYSV